MNLERDIGKILEAIENLGEAQQRFEEHLIEAMNRHEDYDNDRFRDVWKEVGGIKSRLAYYAGGLAIVGFALELLFKS